jgi:uncharacterized protein YbgA (DUF1722 family)
MQIHGLRMLMGSEAAIFFHKIHWHILHELLRNPFIAICGFLWLLFNVKNHIDALLNVGGNKSSILNSTERKSFENVRKAADYGEDEKGRK